MNQQPYFLINGSLLPFNRGVERVEQECNSHVGKCPFVIAFNKKVDNEYHVNNVSISVKWCKFWGSFGG